MHDVSRGGRTVLFVSHNMAAIQALCSRTIWLDRGQVAADGATPAVVTKYLQGARPVDDGGNRQRLLGNSIELRRISVTPNPVSSGGAIELSLTLGATTPVKLGEVAVLVYSSLETRVAVVDLRSANLPARLDANAEWTATATIASLNLVEGDYRIGLFVSSSDLVGDVLDLAELTVHAREYATIAPYDAAHRGVVELDVRIHA
jgi:lipopolysaccharide transport system ATP-binding protein